MIRPRSWTSPLFEPFAHVAGIQALTLGMGAIFVTSLVCSLGHTHFDGVLDSHVGPRSSSPAIFILEGVIDWLSLSLVLALVARFVARAHFRLIDLLGTEALARAPALLISIVMVPGGFRRFSQALVTQLLHPSPHFTINTPDALYFLFAVLLTLPLWIWMVVLMYRAYATSCHVKGASAVATFILGVVVAEILSKIAIYALL